MTTIEFNSDSDTSGCDQSRGHGEPNIRLRRRSSCARALRIELTVGAIERQATYTVGNVPQEFEDN